MTIQPIVRAVKVRKAYGSNVVLDDVSLDVYPGEVVVLIGPSGAGKTTFLRTLNQLEGIDGGAIFVNGELVGYEHHKGSLRQRSKRDIQRQRAQLGMVFQHFNLFPHMTVLQNITHAPIHVRKARPVEARARARELLEMVGLTDKADQYPASLSGGQQQRVAIARSLATEPSVLLFDEPTSALDPELVDDVLQVMRDLSGAGQTMIVVTHEMSFARDVADRVVFMADGRVLEDAPPLKFFQASDNARLTQFLRRVGSDVKG